MLWGKTLRVQTPGRPRIGDWVRPETAVYRTLKGLHANNNCRTQCALNI